MPPGSYPNLPFLAQTLNRSRGILATHLLSSTVFLPFAWGLDRWPRSNSPLEVMLACLPLFFLVVSLVFNIISFYDYTNALALPRGPKDLIRATAYCPILNIVVGAGLYIYSVRVLRGAGASVTLKGVSPDDIAALSLNWCEHCGYSRVGLPRASPCPECGQSPDSSATPPG